MKHFWIQQIFFCVEFKQQQQFYFLHISHDGMAETYTEFFFAFFFSPDVEDFVVLLIALLWKKVWDIKYCAHPTIIGRERSLNNGFIKGCLLYIHFFIYTWATHTLNLLSVWKLGSCSSNLSHWEAELLHLIYFEAELPHLIFFEEELQHLIVS